MAGKISYVALGLSAALATVCASDPVAASGRCATRAEMATLKVAAFQQQLMVAALTCNDLSAYNNFVISYRPELQHSDNAMLHLFLRKDGRIGDAEYNAYKTRLANTSSVQSIGDNDAFCGAAQEIFAALEEHRMPLAEFVWDKPVSVRLPFDGCVERGGPRHIAYEGSEYESGAQGDSE
jgi:hypothetical protein